MSGLRHNTGKLKWSLVDYPSLEPLVKVLEFGTEKYSAENSKRGLQTREIIESLLRHTYALLENEDNDPESGLPHVGHILANAMFLSYMINNKPEYDNRSSDSRTTA